MRERDGKPLEEVLSAAEQRVFRELLTGASDEAIAERLDLGIATIRYHIRNSVRKMEVGDREELIALGSQPETPDGEPGGGPARGEGWGRRRAMFAGLAAVGLLGVAVAVGFAVARFPDGDGPPPPVVPEREVTTPEPAAAVPDPEAATPEPETATPEQETATPERETATAEWNYPNLTFWGDVPETEEALLRTRIEEMASFFEERFGIRVPNLEIHIAASMPALEEALQTTLGYQGDVGTGQYVGGSIFVHWTTGRRGIERLYLEAYQDLMTGSREKGPWWVTEGIASYGAYQFREARGEEAFDDNYASDIGRANRVYEPLSHLEASSTRPGHAQEQYRSLGLVAVAWLLGEAGEGAVATYYEALRNDGWERAFEQAFGFSLEEMYQQFATHREAVVGVRRAVTGRILGPDGEPIRDWPMFVHASYTNGAGSFGTSVPNSGRFTVRVLDGDYQIVVATICPDSSGQLGWYEERSGYTADEQAATVVMVRGEDVAGIVVRLPGLPDELDPGCRLDPTVTPTPVATEP